MIARSLKRRHGQGMTEYIILVGLIAILLVAVVTKFKESIQVTIEGSAEKTEDIADGIGGTGPLAGGTDSGTPSRGTRTFPGETRDSFTDGSGVTWTRVSGDTFERSP